MIRDRHVFKEISSPDAVAKMTEPPMLMLIYKAIYMSLRILLDIRNNTSKKKPKPKTVGNPVIKPTDQIKGFKNG